MKRNPIFTTVGECIDELLPIYRHVMCPLYDTCLDEAVIKNQYFDCSSCSFKQYNIVSYSIHGGMPA